MFNQKSNYKVYTQFKFVAKFDYEDGAKHKRYRHDIPQEPYKQSTILDYVVYERIKYRSGSSRSSYKTGVGDSPVPYIK